LDNIAPLNPINFFQIGCQCHYIKAKGNFGLNADNFTKYLLPSTTSLTGEESFAKIAMAWNEDGLEFFLLVDQPIKNCSYPQIDRGDSFEVCIDTRNIKTSGYNTRFCHHFFCLPEAVEGKQAGEITKFRTEDTHELCDATELKVKSRSKRDSYELQFFIPTHCLFGYDPAQIDRLGMTYRVNRANGKPQQFSVMSEEYQFEQQPSLWSNLRLVPGK
jgi:hypothetical protein